MESEQISHYLNISTTIIRSTIPKEYQEGKENQSRGRYFKITKWQAKAIVKEALKNRHTTYCKIAKKNVAPIVSPKSVNRRIAEKSILKIGGTRESPFG